jgi:hypothetical protein
MFCSKCKMANSDSRQTCTKCGANLPLARSTTRNFNLGTATAAAVALAPIAAEPSPQIAPASKSLFSPAVAPVAAESPVASFAPEPLSLGIQRDYPAFITSRPAVSASAKPARPPKPQASRKAVASFVCGLLFPVLPSAIAAIVYGRRARTEIRASRERLRGAAMATAGVVLGWLGVTLFTGVTVTVLYAHFARPIEARNQASALGTLRSMNSALTAYGVEYGNGFPSDIAALSSGDPTNGNCNHAAMVDSRLASGSKDGYIFHYVPVFPDHRSTPQISPKAAAANCISGGASGYTITADPAEPGKSGSTHFFTDQTGIIRYSDDAAATTASDALR